MVLFLTDSIVDMVRKHVNVVIVKDVADSAKGPVGLLKIESHNRRSHLPDNSVKLPTATLSILRQ